jgi:predicted SAM-dependent methyltransferase
MRGGSNTRVAEFRDYALRDTSSRSRPFRTRREAIVKAALPRRWRQSLRVAATRAIRPISSRRARRLLRAAGPVRLHLGCGFIYEPDWINVDMLGPNIDFAWDLSRPLPLPPDSVDAIFHQNIIEYFTLREALRLTEECRRILRPDGVLRIVGVDGGKSIGLYSEGEGQPDRIAPTSMLSLNSLLFGYGHRIVYDAETLVMLCRAAGFPQAEVSEFGAGRLTPNIDLDEPSRRATSVYVEAWG